jgi:hypothetical protein
MIKFARRKRLNIVVSALSLCCSGARTSAMSFSARSSSVTFQALAASAAACPLPFAVAAAAAAAGTFTGVPPVTLCMLLLLLLLLLAFDSVLALLLLLPVAALSGFRFSRALSPGCQDGFRAVIATDIYTAERL